MNPQNDLYLRGALQMNPSQTTPGPTVALDTLLRLTHSMHDMPFQYAFIDKPRAGTSAIVWHDPARPHWPSDGIRYLAQSQANAGSHAGEKFSTTTHSLPNGANGTGVVELETGVITQGIFPPANPAIPVSKDSPDLQLARFRIRWRIVTPGLGNLALWLVYWGRDERATQRAPSGWEKEPIRRYPLPVIPQDQPPQFPLRQGTALPPHQIELAQPAVSYPPANGPPPPNGGGGVAGSSGGAPNQTQLHAPQHQGKHRRPSSANAPSQQPMPINMQGSAAQGGQFPAFQQGRPGGIPAQGTSHGPSPQQTRQNTPKQSAAAARKAQKAASKEAQSQAHPVQAPHPAAAAAAAQLQAQALPTVPAHLRNGMLSSAAHTPFPQLFSDPYDYLSTRSWAGIRYEHNHSSVAPIFDAVRYLHIYGSLDNPTPPYKTDTLSIESQSTTSELIEAWVVPEFPDLDKINAEISMLKKEVEALKTRQQQFTGKNALHTQSGDVSIASLQLARKGSIASNNIAKEKELLIQHQNQAALEALLAPLPRMMPVAEMHDKAMQAHNARRKEIEEALQAQRAAKEEEDRLERERLEAEEATRKALEEKKQEEERKQRQARDEEEENRAKEEAERVKKEKIDVPETLDSQPSVTVVSGSSEGPSLVPAPVPPFAVDTSAATSGQTNGAQPDNETGAPYADDMEDEGQQQDQGTEYFDESYNLLMNNFGTYGNDNDYTLDGGMGGDEMMIGQSLFADYMDQMGSM